MGALRTCCGYYCSFTAIVGIYFFVVLAVLEYSGSAFLNQILQNIEKEEGEEHVPEQPDMKAKGQAFLILAVIQVFLVIGCYMCGAQSAKADAEEAEQAMRRPGGF